MDGGLQRCGEVDEGLHMHLLAQHHVDEEFQLSAEMMEGIGFVQTHDDGCIGHGLAHEFFTGSHLFFDEWVQGDDVSAGIDQGIVIRLSPLKEEILSEVHALLA